MSPTTEEQILRYTRQVVLKTMDAVRARMRGSARLELKEVSEVQATKKSELNLTKAVDREAEELVISTLAKKFGKIAEVQAFTVFSEEIGIQTFPAGASEADADLVVFVDPIDGTEFIESLQGGWCLIGVYSRSLREVVAIAAGDMFLNRLYFASRSGPAECVDFETHSWFKLDGGSSAKKSMAEGPRINFLTTKVSRYLAVAKQEKFLKALQENDGRMNLSWGSNMIVQVATGDADAAVEFAKGFATYDVLPGLFIGEKAGLTILRPDRSEVKTSEIDIDEVFSVYRDDPKHPLRTPFVAAKSPELAHEIVDLLTV